MVGEAEDVAYHIGRYLDDSHMKAICSMEKCKKYGPLEELNKSLTFMT